MLAAKKMTIEALGAKAGMTKATLHNIFNKNDSKLSHLQRIAEVLQVPVFYLLGEEQEPTLPQPYELDPKQTVNEVQETEEVYRSRQEQRISALEAALDRCLGEKRSLEKELQLKDQLLKAREDLIAQIQSRS
jgi:transcriptional regulator with XRE-family HTH domain